MVHEIEMSGIVKRFGDLLANDHIDLQIEKGEIRALVGENGAGKTTLMRVLFGLYRPNAGTIKLRGKEVQFSSPHDAIAHHLGMMHQHFMLFEDLSVLENIIYGLEPRRWGFIDTRKAREAIQSLARQYSFEIKIDAKVSSLSVGEKQRVEILKTLYRGAEIIILDEPTAVLTPQEREELFKVLRNLSAQGKTIVLITHKLREVMELSHRATVLRRGKLVGTVETAHTNPVELACMMVGREVFLKVEKPPAEVGEVVLEVKNLSLLDKHHITKLDDVTFNVRRGEIVGLAGVAGNGQAELVNVLVGFVRPAAGQIRMNGVDITHLGIGQRRQLGFAYIPEDRYQRGLAMTESITENLVLGFQHLSELSSHGIMSPRLSRKWAENILRRYDVRYKNPDEPAGNLSGGNLQKLILAREFTHSARFILADQPTRGVDIGATEFIYQQVVERRNTGDGILFISADLNEIMSVSDRILVMFNGKIVASLAASQVTEQECGLYMAGHPAHSLP